MAAIAAAAAAIALRPFSGAMPACAATPWKSAVTIFCDGARVMTAPTGPVLSKTKPARAPRPTRSSALAPRSPDLLAGREDGREAAGRRRGGEVGEQRRAAPRRRPCRRRRGWCRRRCAPRRPRRRPRSGRSTAHRVHVRGHDDRRAAALAGQHARRCCRCRRRCAAALSSSAGLEPGVAQIAQDEVGHGPLVARRRGDLDQPHEQVEQVV